jgi:hypothetical protein
MPAPGRMSNRMNARRRPRGSALGRQRHVVQFQLGVLELERTRREQERQTARRKIAQVEHRLRQLDTLIRERQHVLDEGEV